MQYKNPLHKLYELFAFHLSSSFLSRRISLYLEERLAWRTIHGVSRLLSPLFLPRKSIENRGSWLDDRFLAKVEPRQGRIRKGEVREIFLPLSRSTQPNETSTAVITNEYPPRPGFLPSERDATFRSRRSSNDGKRPRHR